ncbi:type III secretion protein [Cryobacterium sp. TMS1-20-1]|uniref:flagellar biosynthetic protein FliR n=1 Tax=unclassified Cryobacterium TaxID=2649013 RepID=UPI00106CFD54|nr:MULTISPECIES: flagellar biosynthetic protein FliR [unclassified Cryobacterium]TFC75575.1 type III secretion protein [Cryobacterium sp. TMS1-20-1]TFD51419.1 type III secretion protein [Cryobacterium sp. Hh11]TFD58579.1 type III secretion protein [Cryobacterium sp. Hh7]
MEFVLNFSMIEATMLAGVRMIAFLVIAPPFSFNAFPLRIKAMLALGLALAVSPVVTTGYETLDTPAFIGALVLEVVVGAVLGILVFIIFAAIQVAGGLIDMFGGFSMAQGFDPQSMVNGAQFTRLFHMTAIGLMFASDSYQLIIGGLVRTFTAIPLGGGLNLADPVEAMIGAVSQMFLASVQIAGPLLVVLFLADAGLGLITRVSPALNAFALGFPLKIYLTLTLGSIVFIALPGIVSTLTGQAAEFLLGVR